MPYLRRIKHRSKRSNIVGKLKIALLIAFISCAAGFFTLFINNSFGPNTAGSTDFVSAIIKQYKDKYGTGWKTKLKEDYKTYKKDH